MKQITKYRLGVMSSTWELLAENADIAVAVSVLYLGNFMPIAIYEPENAKSKFSMVQSEELAEEFGKFIVKNKDSILNAKKTFKKLL